MPHKSRSIAIWLCAALILFAGPTLAASRGQSNGPSGATGQSNAPGAPQDNGETASPGNGRPDQDTALRAMQSGRAEPLADIIRSLPPGLQGRLVDVHLITSGTRLVYRLKILSRGGVLKQVLIDARTGKPM